MQNTSQALHYGGGIVEIRLKINDLNKKIDVEPGEMLYDTLKKFGITSVKKSCGNGCCGICTVLIDGIPIPSCAYLAVKADGHSITTIEGVTEEADKIGHLMTDEGAVQCGFCTPGFALTIIAMKNELKNPTEEEIKSYLVGNMCRCSGYQGQLRAIKKYLEVS